MIINPFISCVGSINFINSISAIVLIPSFQSFPSIPSNPYSIVSLSPFPLTQSVPYSLRDLTSASINSICTSKFTISFHLFLPTKIFHWFHHKERSHMTWCQILCSMRLQCVSKILTPRRMLQKTSLIAKINLWTNSFQNMYDML